MHSATRLMVFLVLHAAAFGAEVDPLRTWTNNAGRSFVGTYQRSDGITSWIKTAAGPVAAVPMADLAPGDQAVVRSLQSDFSWRLKSARWPGTVSAPATRPAFRISAESNDGIHVFRTRSFEFRIDQDLSPQVVGEFGRTFEASSELCAQLPWGVRPAPPGGRFYQARLFSERGDFLAVTGARDQGFAKVAGLYKRDDRIIYVPLESLNSKDEASMGTLRHELAHQMMHDMLPVMPWWVAEGTAEYIRIVPWDGRGACECAGAGSVQVMKRIAAEGRLNLNAFTSLFKDEWPAFPEAQVAQSCETAHRAATAQLLEIRKKRADMLAEKPPPAPVPPQSAPPMRLQQIPPYQPTMRPIDGLDIVLQYHAAKLFVYYLQHLEGDGKGTTMLQLMWHLRQWADETIAQRARFEEQTKQFLARFQEVQTRLRGFDNLEKAYQQAVLKSARATPAPTPAPSQPGAPESSQPIAPEEELFKLLPPPPDPGLLTPATHLARWADIKKKSIGESPERHFNAILAAFKARKVEVPVR